MYRGLATLRAARASLRRATLGLPQRHVQVRLIDKKWLATRSPTSEDDLYKPPASTTLMDRREQVLHRQFPDLKQQDSVAKAWTNSLSAPLPSTTEAPVQVFGTLDIYTKSALLGFSLRDALSTEDAPPARHDYAAELYKNKALHIARVYNYAFELYWESSLRVPRTDDETLQALHELYDKLFPAVSSFAPQKFPEPQEDTGAHYLPSRSLAKSKVYVQDEREDGFSHDEVLAMKAKHKAEMEKQHAYTKSVGTTVARDKRGFEWEENPNYEVKKYWDTTVKTYEDLPHPHERFGEHQHMIVDPEFKEALKSVLNCFPTIRYAFAYGSGVFPQSKRTGRVPTDAELRAIHPNAPAAVKRTQDGSPKMIDFIFGVPLTSHWHSLNLKRNRDHYSGLARLGSDVVTSVQDNWGAGVYYNPYVIVNGILIKYGVVNIDILTKDLYEWNTLYLAGRLHKPVKILRDHPQVRLANQVNLLAAMRVALLLLPEEFSERELYATIAGLSYLGDPRMALPTENPKKIDNIVGNNIPSFRRLYSPLIDNMPNLSWNRPQTDTDDWYLDLDLDIKMRQDLDPVRRGNMVRRLPKAFRSKLYFQYQKKFAIPRGEFNRMMEEYEAEDSELKRRDGGGFEQRIAKEDIDELRKFMRESIKQTISWPSTTQSIKGLLTAGTARSWRYMGEKMEKWKQGTGRSKA